MIAFHLPIVPPKATSQSAGKRIVVQNGKPMFFKNAKAQSAENDLTLLCSQYRPAVPLEGPLALQIDFVFPWRATEPKWRLALRRVPHTSKPDCSNVVKMLEDCLTKLGFWKDDSQVADLHVTKAWGDQVGIRVAVRPLEVSPRGERRSIATCSSATPGFDTKHGGNGAKSASPNPQQPSLL